MMVKTKIIATLGPASDTRAVLRKMIISGLDIVRLNFSHGTAGEHLRRISIIKGLNQSLRRAIKIMQDLEGYRIRIIKLKRPVVLKRRSYIYLTQDETEGDGRWVTFDYQGSLTKINSGMLIYIDDGKIVLEVVSRHKRYLKLRVLVPGLLKSNKGINIPDVDLEFPPLTDKDRDDLNIAIENKLDYLAQSFVRRAKDLRLLRDVLRYGHWRCKIFAKIENKTAIRNIDEIIAEADGIIVARGDLGICIPIYKVPVVQKEIIKKCRIKGKPVVVATQMLDSMTQESLPTRAEVSDVANAILDGATHLLLSAETAIGKHPHEAVDMMNKIIKNTEDYGRKLKNLWE
jgi:pyruvate kinase